MSFEALKKNRSQLVEKMAEAAQQHNSGKKNYVDERMWQPTVDKMGTGSAVIRFLPNPNTDELPWVRFWEKGFKGPTGLWYIEKCLTSIDQPDPVVEMNNQLYNTGREEDREIARSRKRRELFVANILVVSDPAKPENEGKVFLYKFGKRIFNKINEALHPQFEDEERFDPFDFWGGANFRMKIRKVDGQRNYDKCTFDSPSPLYDGDEDKLKDVYDRLYQISEFVDPSTYKSYDELKERLIRVLGEEEGDNRIDAMRSEIQSSQDGGDEEEEEIPMEFPAKKKDAAPDNNDDDGGEEEEEDMEDFFKKLASES